MISQSTLAAASRVAEWAGCRTNSSVVSQALSPDSGGQDADPASDHPLATLATAASVASNLEGGPERPT
jgi:hypothetical protein